MKVEERHETIMTWKSKYPQNRKVILFRAKTGKKNYWMDKKIGENSGSMDVEKWKWLNIFLGNLNRIVGAWKDVFTMNICCNWHCHNFGLIQKKSFLIQNKPNLTENLVLHRKVSTFSQMKMSSEENRQIRTPSIQSNCIIHLHCFLS